jgi:hypothetical protein
MPLVVVRQATNITRRRYDAFYEGNLGLLRLSNKFWDLVARSRWCGRALSMIIDGDVEKVRTFME